MVLQHLEAKAVSLPAAADTIADSQCDQCHVKGMLAITRRVLPDDVIDLSIDCLNCGRTEHSCYTTEALEALADKIRKEIDPFKRVKRARQYARDFNALQARMLAAELKAREGADGVAV